MTSHRTNATGRQRKGWLGLLLTAIFTVALAGQAGATWSVVGVDPDTGEVGVAVASCVELGALSIDDGFELVALAPGHGAGVSQAAFNSDARVEIQRLLDAGSTAAETISAITAESFDSNANDRQHAVVLLSGEVVGFTGASNSDVAVDVQGTNVSAQGNILVNESVATDAVAAFEGGPADSALATRLVNALEAGSLAGGDSRCGDQTALFAHVSVIDANGSRSAPNVVDLTTWVERGDSGNPVFDLAELYRSGTTKLQPDSASLPTPSIPLWFWLVPLSILLIIGAGLLAVVRRIRNR